MFSLNYIMDPQQHAHNKSPFTTSKSIQSLGAPFVHSTKVQPEPHTAQGQYHNQIYPQTPIYDGQAPSHNSPNIPNMLLSWNTLQTPHPLKPSTSSTPKAPNNQEPDSFFRRFSPSSRTLQACEMCRRRKAKCSGDRPTCKRCASRDLDCQYLGREERKRLLSKTRKRDTANDVPCTPNGRDHRRSMSPVNGLLSRSKPTSPTEYHHLSPANFSTYATQDRQPLPMQTSSRSTLPPGYPMPWFTGMERVPPMTEPPPEILPTPSFPAETRVSGFDQYGQVLSPYRHAVQVGYQQSWDSPSEFNSGSDSSYSQTSPSSSSVDGASPASSLGKKLPYELSIPSHESSFDMLSAPSPLSASSCESASSSLQKKLPYALSIPSQESSFDTLSAPSPLSASSWESPSSSLGKKLPYALSIPSQESSFDTLSAPSPLSVSSSCESTSYETDLQFNQHTLSALLNAVQPSLQHYRHFVQDEDYRDFGELPDLTFFSAIGENGVE